MADLVILVFSSILFCFFTASIFNIAAACNRNITFFFIFSFFLSVSRAFFSLFSLFSRSFVTDVALSAAVGSRFAGSYFSVAGRWGRRFAKSLAISRALRILSIMVLLKTIISLFNWALYSLLPSSSSRSAIIFIDKLMILSFCSLINLLESIVARSIVLSKYRDCQRVFCSNWGPLIH